MHGSMWRGMETEPTATAPFPDPTEDHTHALREIFTEIIEQLNPVRRHRTYPRAIRRGRHSAYRVKRPTDTGIRHDQQSKIILARTA
ncbi:hypothetical protein ThrDRAFT_04086 [Frankia casuarinae]|nr:hypothetical protein CcI6DRAFT_04463 [Frankia sp. CcI6]EYT90275.1 hypothetical protein ThrDRAFT_04086 [Frankia casuarinae]KEZ34587.1 hypothetical protein CEDDRAFT_04051 [Frankia sp. CeD]OAA18791.1 hypothetical protein AAY23_111615 [Frankia casuarinae]